MDHEEPREPLWTEKGLQQFLQAEVALTELPDGCYRAEKGGFVGVGDTPEAAALDLGHKVATAMAPPGIGRPFDGAPEV